MQAKRKKKQKQWERAIVCYLLLNMRIGGNNRNWGSENFPELCWNQSDEHVRMQPKKVHSCTHTHTNGLTITITSCCFVQRWSVFIGKKIDCKVYFRFYLLFWNSAWRPFKRFRLNFSHRFRRRETLHHSKVNATNSWHIILYFRCCGFDESTTWTDGEIIENRIKSRNCFICSAQT